MAMTAAEKQKAYRARQKKAKTGGAEKEAVGLISEAETSSTPVRVGMSETTSKGNTRRTAVTVPPKNVAATVKDAPGRDVSVTTVERDQPQKSSVPGSRKQTKGRKGVGTTVGYYGEEKPKQKAVSRNVTRGPATQPGDSPTGGRVPTGTRSDKEKKARNLPASRTETAPVGATGVISERSPSATEKAANRAGGRRKKAEGKLKEATQALPEEVGLLAGQVRSGGLSPKAARKAIGKLARTDPGFRTKMAAGMREAVPALEQVDKAKQAESRRKVRVQREQSGAALPRIQNGRKVEDSPEGVGRRLRGTVYNETPLAEDKTLANLKGMADAIAGGDTNAGQSAARRTEARMGRRLSPAVAHPSGAGDGQMGLFSEAEGKKMGRSSEPNAARGGVSMKEHQTTMRERQQGEIAEQAERDVADHPLYSRLHEMGSGQQSISGRSVFHDAAEAMRLNVGDTPSLTDITHAIGRRQSERSKQRKMGTLPGQPKGEEVGRMTPSTPTYKGAKGEMGEAAVAQKAAGIEKAAKKSSRMSGERKQALGQARSAAIQAGARGLAGMPIHGGIPATPDASAALALRRNSRHPNAPDPSGVVEGTTPAAHPARTPREGATRSDQAASAAAKYHESTVERAAEAAKTRRPGSQSGMTPGLR